MSSLFKEYAVKTEIPLSAEEQAIGEYIKANRREYYDDIIVADSRFAVFLQLSVLRTGLLSWYDFRPEARLLEIGAGFGALTGLFCEKCRHVTATERSAFRAEHLALRWQQKENLDIYAGEWSEMNFTGPYDYIVLNGILSRSCGGSRNRKDYAAYLKKLAAWLKPTGILLFSAENRLGLKYFCGAGEPHTKRAFDGINGYPQGTGGYSFSRQEVAEIVMEAGFPAHKFYYPLPDYKLPQLIYTDRHLPEQNLKERLIPYYYPPKNMIAVEAELYQDVVENGVFPFFANSFLVECGRGQDFGTAVYAAVSTDRGAAYSYATVINEIDKIKTERSVAKKALFSAGQENMRKLHENMADLKRRGIPVVMTERTDVALLMPHIPFPTLSNYLKELIKVDSKRFEEILDELYAFILQSSEPAATGENLLLRRLQQPLSVTEGEKIAALNWGPILKKAYMELIPLNCFYDAEGTEKDNTQRYLFFDQEFVRESYPAGYVIFRAIHYIYCFTPHAEACLPQQKLREKYGLTAVWDYYLQEEGIFLQEIRNQQTYRQFYGWARTDYRAIWQNADKLMSEEEKIANYKVSDKMKKIWQVELALLDAVDKICRKHNIRYFMLNGTLLGAVRHQGFIPWDDDLDIGMLRADYDKFLQVAPTELPEPLFLQTMWNEPDCMLGGGARLRNSMTTALPGREFTHDSNQGICIDILPLCPVTQEEKKLTRKNRKIKYYHRLFYAQIYGRDYDRWGDLPPLLWRFFRLVARLYSRQSLCRRLDRAMRLYSEEESPDLSTFTGYGQQRLLHKSDFQETVPLPFAGKNYPAPAGYENYLFMVYGRDYLRYPPEEERKPKHDGIYDPERSYREYRRLFSGMFQDIRGKKLILFGSGMMFEDYMKKWGGRYRPDFLVDNDENKWGRKRMGIDIKAPTAILAVPEAKRRVIICSFYYKEIGKQLADMGVGDYQVYVQNVEWILRSEEEQG